MFSRRVPADLGPNLLSRAVQELRSAHTAFIDLTESNPTRAGLEYPPGLLSALATPEGFDYDPKPLGMLTAREAVVSEYARRGIRIHPSHIALTTSTSESYSYLFRL